MKYVSFLLVLLLLPYFAISQGGDKSTGLSARDVSLDLEAFQQNVEIAYWLYQYDMVAWRTSDSLLASTDPAVKELTKEWFCYEDSLGLWHAIYGKYDSEYYQPLFHYVLNDSTSRIRRVGEKIDTSLSQAYARALTIGYDKLGQAMSNYGIRFNAYLRRQPNNCIELWFLPAWQPDGRTIYGAEFKYVFDPKGKRLLNKIENFHKLRALTPDRSTVVQLDYKTHKIPPVSSIFFLWSYNRYFGEISIKHFYGKTSLRRAGEEWIWVHEEGG
jgi:hypothetical protein